MVEAAFRSRGFGEPPWARSTMPRPCTRSVSALSVAVSTRNLGTMVQPLDVAHGIRLTTDLDLPIIDLSMVGSAADGHRQLDPIFGHRHDLALNRPFPGALAVNSARFPPLDLDRDGWVGGQGALHRRVNVN